MTPPDEPVTEETVGKTDPFANVVGITGRPYIPAPEEFKPGDVDEIAIEMLQSAIEDFRSGKFRGVVIVMGKLDKQGNLKEMRDYCSESAIDNSIFFAGAVGMTKQGIEDSMGVTDVPHEFDPEDFSG